MPVVINGSSGITSPSVTTTSGNVGIGTNSPTGRVTIEGSQVAAGTLNALTLRNSSDGGIGLYFDNSVSNNLASIEALVTSSGAGTDDGVLSFSTATNGTNTERMRIDSIGRVTMPNQPSFSVWNVGGSTALSGNMILNTVLLNNGGHYSTSTGRFTAPVAGRYHFSFTGFIQQDTSFGDVAIYINGAQWVRTYSNEATGVYRPFAITAITQLAAGDYVQPNSVATLHANANPIFSGHLLG